MELGQAEERKFFIANLIAGFVRKLFKFSILVSVVVLVMNYLLGMGEWSLLGMRIADLARRGPWATLLIGTAYYVVFQPIAVFAGTPRASIRLCYITDADDWDYARGYFLRLLRLFATVMTIASILFCALAFAFRAPLIGLLGHPIADIAVLVVVFLLCWFASPIVGVLFTRLLSRESPRLYLAFMEAVRSGQFSGWSV